MAACTLEELKAWGVSGNDTQLQIYLDDALRAVVRDGVPEASADFHYLHRLRTVCELPSSGQQAFLAIRSRKVDGVGIEYADATVQDAKSPMERYRSELMAVIGTGRMVV